MSILITKDEKNIQSGGYSLLEVLVYVGLISTVLLLTLATLFEMTHAYARAHSELDALSAGNEALERMVREARGAVSIDQTNSVFGTSTGVLTLNTATASGTVSTVKFYVSSGSVFVDEGGSTRGSLTKPSIYVSSLIFRRFATTTSEGVKIELSIQNTQATAQVTENFYSSAVLRGSYQ